MPVQPKPMIVKDIVPDRPHMPIGTILWAYSDSGAGSNFASVAITPNAPRAEFEVPISCVTSLSPNNTDLAGVLYFLEAKTELVKRLIDGENQFIPSENAIGKLRRVQEIIAGSGIPDTNREATLRDLAVLFTGGTDNAPARRR